MSICNHVPGYSNPKWALINNPAHDDCALFRFWKKINENMRTHFSMKSKITTKVARSSKKSLKLVFHSLSGWQISVKPKNKQIFK